MNALRLHLSVLVSVVVTLTVGCIELDNDFDAGDTEQPPRDTDTAETSDASDGSTDRRDVPPLDRSPVGFSDGIWTTLSNMSPAEGIAPPTDPTNKYTDDPQAIKLGHYLFFEEAISGPGDVSCASCHDPDEGFADPDRRSTAAGGEERPTKRHAPSLLNVAYNQWYFWDGRRSTLWNQAIVPYEAPIEMAGTRLQLAHYVYETPEIKRAYEKAFGSLPARSKLDPFPDEGRPVADPSTPEQRRHDEAWQKMTDEDRKAVNRILVNVMKAMAAYEMQLVSLNAPFDRFVDQVRRYPEQPDKWTAISESARNGAKLFVNVGGCTECHSGPMLKDDEFHNLGLPDRSWTDPDDKGRWAGLEELKASDFPFGVTGPYSDASSGEVEDPDQIPQLPQQKGAFKTPILRNVAETPPYMHAGHFEDLAAVLEFYNEPPDDSSQVGDRSGEIRPLFLSDKQLADLEAFLKSLDGSVPDRYTSPPESPLVDN